MRLALFISDDLDLLAVQLRGGQDLTDEVGVLAVCTEDLQGGIHVLGSHHDAHTNAHVVGVEHVALGDVTRLGDEVEDGENLHVGAADAGTQALGNASRDVLVEAAARDVGDTLDRHLLQECQDGLDVDLGGGQEGLLFLHCFLIYCLR